MKRAAKSPRHADLARIHMLAASQKLIDGSDDSLYRAMLRTVARVDSAKDLDHVGRAAVLRHLTASGKQPGKALNASDQVKFINHLWTKLHEGKAVRDGSDAALRSFVRSQSAKWNPDGVGYDAPEMLPQLAAQRVIEQLKRWCQRCKIDFR